MTVLWHALEILAAVLVSIALRGLFLVLWPYRPCRWCRPGGVLGGSAAARLAGHEPERERRGSCWRCKGTRITRRLGARTAHRVKLVLAEAWQEREFWR